MSSHELAVGLAHEALVTARYKLEQGIQSSWWRLT